MRLSGRVIAITGASRGIGRDLAEAIIKEGGKVLAGARRPDGGDIEGAVFQALDVTNEDSVQQFAAKAREMNVDTLINNAGVGTFGPIESITPASYHEVMDTNVLGTILVTRAFIPIFREKKSGLVINVTSDVSDRTFAGGALYTASKHAQRAVTRALALEGKEYGLRVTEIRPGMTDTYFAASEQGAAHKSDWLKVADVTAAVMYAMTAPSHVRVDEIMLHPVAQDVAF